MSDTQQVGPDGYRRVMSNGYRQIGGTTCCCGSTPHVPANCNDCISCVGCDTLIVTVEFPSTVNGDHFVTTTLVRETAQNCSWSSETTSDTMRCGSPQCGGDQRLDKFSSGVFVPAPCWTLNVLDSVPASGCVAFFIKANDGLCPTAGGWTVNDKPFTGGGSAGYIALCGNYTITSMSCGGSSPAP
jgi:hypothetical protein